MLSDAKVAIIGVGGLGCHVAQGLVRLGIKQIRLIDSGKVELSNLPRQVLFDMKDINQFKVDVASEKLTTFSGDLKLDTSTTYLTELNGAELLKNCDIVVDCTDNYASRFAISKTSNTLQIPMVYGGVNQYEGQVGVFNFLQTPTFHHFFPNTEEMLLLEDCTASGVLPFVVSTVASLQIAEIFKIITQNTNVLAGKLLCINVLSSKQRILKLKLPEIT